MFNIEGLNSDISFTDLHPEHRISFSDASLYLCRYLSLCSLRTFGSVFLALRRFCSFSHAIQRVDFLPADFPDFRTFLLTWFSVKGPQYEHIFTISKLFSILHSEPLKRITEYNIRTGGTQWH